MSRPRVYGTPALEPLCPFHVPHEDWPTMPLPAGWAPACLDCDRPARYLVAVPVAIMTRVLPQLAAAAARLRRLRGAA